MLPAPSVLAGRAVCVVRISLFLGFPYCLVSKKLLRFCKLIVLKKYAFQLDNSVVVTSSPVLFTFVGLWQLLTLSRVLQEEMG